MTGFRFTKPPSYLRHARKDNLALVSGDPLSEKAIYQQVANALPRGAVLIVIPENNPIQKQAMLDVAKQLSRQGVQVSVIPSTRLTKNTRR